MAQNQGTLVITAVRPNDSLDTYPVAIANEIKGGHHNYLTLNDIYAIPADRRQAGMLVTVTNDPQSAFNNTYVLQANLITWAYLNERYIMNANLENLNSDYILKILLNSPYQFKVDKLYLETEIGSCTVNALVNIGQGGNASA